MKRLGVLALGILLAAIAIWHPAPRAPAATVAAPTAARPKMRRAVRHRHSATVKAVTSMVYVVGAVAHPGLYRVAPSARINDAVRAAGGMLPGADPAGIDLAAHVADGDEVDVLRIGEVPQHTVRKPRKRVSARKSKRKSPPSEPVDINAADPAALATVPGIGLAIAQRIVALRAREGAYASFDELLDVAGMSPARLDRAQPYLSLR